MSDLSTLSHGIASLIEDTAERGNYSVKVTTTAEHRTADGHIVEPSSYLSEVFFAYAPAEVMCCHSCQTVMVILY